MDLPSGTVTFLFTDIEGSTRLLQELGDDYAGALDQHSEIIRSSVAANDGVEVSTEGDAFFCVFREAPAAAAAAVAILRGLSEAAWPGESEFKVRIGFHTGEGVLGGDNYVGMDVHRAARISAAGHGGQALLSAETHDLVVGSLPEGVTTTDLGEHELKDIPEPEHIYQLVVPGMQEVFPPLRTQATPPLPLPPLVAPAPSSGAAGAAAAAATSTGLLASLTKGQLALATLIVGLVAGGAIGGLAFGGGECDDVCPDADVESAPAIVATTSPATTQAAQVAQAQAETTVTSLEAAPTTTEPPVSSIAGLWIFTVNVTDVTGSVCQGEIGDVYDREVLITGTDDSLELVGLDDLDDPDDPAWTGSFSDGELKFGGVRAEDDGLTIAAFEMTLLPDGESMVGTEAWVWDWTSRGETGTCIDGISTVTAVRP